MFMFSNRRISFRNPMLLGLVIVSFAAAFYKVAQRPAATSFQMSTVVKKTGEAQTGKAAGISTHFVSTQQNIATHAASLIELSDGRIRAFWFAGSREGAEDVEIRSAVFDPAKDSWGPEHSIAT